MAALVVALLALGLAFAASAALWTWFADTPALVMAGAALLWIWNLTAALELSREGVLP